MRERERDKGSEKEGEKDNKNIFHLRGAYIDDLVNNWYSPVKDSGDVREAAKK